MGEIGKERHEEGEQEPSVLLVHVLDSGREALDLVGLIAEAEDPPWYAPILGSFGVPRFRSFVITPTRDTGRRAANALDEFAGDLDALSRSVGEPELADAASRASTWGSDLWDQTRSASEIQSELRSLLAGLDRRRVSAALARNRRDPDARPAN